MFIWLVACMVAIRVCSTSKYADTCFLSAFLSEMNYLYIRQ